MSRGGVRTATFGALGFTFSVECDVVGLTHFLDHVLAPLVIDAPATHLFVLEVDDVGTGRVVLDGEAITDVLPPQQLISYLLHHVNLRTVPATPNHLCLFAGGVARGADALLLPAPGDAGKTTLVAGLVEAGFDYITDETVAIDPVTTEVAPYPKPLSIEWGSFDLLAHLRPAVDAALEPFLAMQWQVPATDIRPGALAGTTKPRWIISPQYRPEQPTALTSMTRGQAAALLGWASPNFPNHGRQWLPVLAAIASGCDCYELAMGDLPSAVACVRGVIG